jgi:hypothetical protein
MCALLLAPASATSGWCEGFGTVEARVVKPLAPDLTLAMGGGVSVSVGELPAGAPIVNGRTLFGDLVWVPGGVAAGASVSLRPPADDNGLRLGAAMWRGNGFRWSVYLARALDLDW